ncbi:MAG: hypothetical protein EOP22_05035 [Hyphomicrobiales bacterium]|nr:MAG: hypothetical protein EOP22_05035 [Hyphomicrobiales bacterium]
MLYQDRVIGRNNLWSRIAGGLALAVRARRRGDYELLSMNGHLRRDIGVGEALERVRFDELRFR